MKFPQVKYRRLLKKRYLIPAALVLLVGGYFVYSRAHAGNTTPTYVTAQVQKGMIDSSVSSTGNITEGQTANVVAATSGTVENLVVKSGDHVTKGQVLFSVKNDQLDVTIDKSYASYAQAQQSLDSAYAQSSQAQADLDNAVGQSGAPTIANMTALNAKIKAAEASVYSAQQSFNQAESNYQDNPTTPNLSAAKQAQSQLASANSNLAQSKSDYIKAQQQNQAAIENIQALSDKTGSAASSINAAESSVAATGADYDYQQQNAADQKTVKSPIDGVITSLNVEEGSILGNSGTVTAVSSGQSSSETSGASSSSSQGGSSSTGTSSTGTSSSSGSSSSSSSAAIVIQNIDALKVTVSVSEVDVYKLAVGQKATLTLDAIEDLSLTGKVSSIDVTGTVSSGVVTYNVTIVPDITNARIKPSMTVSAIITTQIKQDVITVPNSAVKTQGTSNYVEIMENGVPKQQNVTIGISNDTLTEIASGLNEGDTVVTQTISSSAASTSSGSSGGLGIGGLGGGSPPSGGSGGSPPSGGSAAPSGGAPPGL